MTPAARPQPLPTTGRSSSHVLPDVLCHARLADDDPLARQVRADLIERAEAGLRKYGAYLTTHNGRDALWDWYQELLDGVMYARQANLERDDRDPVLWELYQESVRQACALRDYIQILPR